MASIITRPNGHKALQLVTADGSRKTIHLGKFSDKKAHRLKIKIEDLASSAISGLPLDEETAAWLQKLDGPLRDRLVHAGLASPRGKATLGAFLKNYVASRTDVKGTTRTIWNHTRRNLIQFFGADRPLSQITAGDAKRWRIWLAEQPGERNKANPEPLSPTTINKRCAFAKQFFNAAIDDRILSSNPFAVLDSANRSNPDRQYFVSRAEIDAVLEACPDPAWRLIVALCRYGGLRCPSETSKLRWGDIDWARNRFRVTSPKTEHHEGKGFRVVPIFPELRPYLDECFELAKAGQESVIAPYHRQANLRTRFEKIIARAGLAAWPKLFQNLRSTRETELADVYPGHVVCAWLGNTPAVAKKHYLQVTDEHFASAAMAANDATPDRRAAKCAAVPAGNRGKRPQGNLAAHEKTPVFQGVSSQCNALRNVSVERKGFEPSTSALRTQRSPN